MRLSKRKKMLIGVILIFVIIVGFNYKSIIKTYKINDMKKIVSKYNNKSLSEVDALAKLMEKYKNDETVTTEYEESFSIIKGVSYTENNDEDKNVTTTSSRNIQIENLSRLHGKGSQKLRLKILNNSKDDIAYVKINLFEYVDGKVINSDYTVCDKIVVSDGETVVETYFDYQSSDSELKYKLENIRYE